jgi:HK97 family phage prohead protease
MIRKEFTVTKDPDGWWVASTPALDRDKDHVMPFGLELERYRANPVLMWGHNYRDPWALIGRAAQVQATDADLRIQPEWREPANESDPMHVIRSLIDSGLVRALSIGFNPLEYADNEHGGRDYQRAEILEISVVPIPANQEALRLAAKALTVDDTTGDTTDAPEFDPEPAVTLGAVAGVVLKPLPSEHACRLRAPGDFQPDSFRSTEREHEGKAYRVIMGRLKGEESMTEQSYRYDRETWGAAEASAHCRTHDGRFEAAKQLLDMALEPTTTEDADGEIESGMADHIELTPEQENAFLSLLSSWLDEIGSTITGGHDGNADG